MSVTRSGESFVAGTFSGVLGSQDPGHDTGNVPPDYVVNLTNGVFKHAKRTVLPEVNDPGRRALSLSDRRFARLSPDDMARDRQQPKEARQ